MTGFSQLGLAAALAAGIFLAGLGVGTSRANKRHEFQRLQAVEKAREREAQWQIDVQALDEVRDEEVNRLSASLDAARRELRNRVPDRVPAASSPACDGASPAALSAADADVALGLAAEADRLRADVQACRAWIEAVTR